MRALIVGAVEGTQVAIQTIAASAGWSDCGVMTLPPDKSDRHSHFVDLSTDADKAGARIIYADNSNSEEACRAVEELAPDYTFIIGWSQICGPAFLAAAKGNVIGYHPAALPRLRGRAALPWTILLDEKITASTLFWIDDGVDSGDILAQKFFHVAPREKAATLYRKHMLALQALLHIALAALRAGDKIRQTQDLECATYATKRVPADGLIDWRRSASEIDRLIRAVGRPYPGAFTGFKDRRVTVYSSEIRHGTDSHALPGQIVARQDRKFSVMCGDGMILDIDDYECAPDDVLPPLHAVLGRAA
jgi:methionyl-tRNA formyltransferase